MSNAMKGEPTGSGPSDPAVGRKIVGYETAEGDTICLHCAASEPHGDPVTLGFAGECSRCRTDLDAELGPPDGSPITDRRLEKDLEHSLHAKHPVIDPAGVAEAEVQQHLEDLSQLQTAGLKEAEVWGRKLLGFLLDHHEEVKALYDKLNKSLDGQSPPVATLALIMLAADGADQIPAPREAIAVVIQGLSLGKAPTDGN